MVGLQLRGQDVVVEYAPNERASHQSIGMISSVLQSSLLNVKEKLEDIE